MQHYQLAVNAGDIGAQYTIEGDKALSSFFTSKFASNLFNPIDGADFNNPDSVFEYIGNTTFKTLDSLVNAKSQYSYQVEQSEAYYHSVDSAPYIQINWKNESGEYLTTSYDDVILNNGVTTKTLSLYLDSNKNSIKDADELTYGGAAQDAAVAVLVDNASNAEIQAAIDSRAAILEFKQTSIPYLGGLSENTVVTNSWEYNYEALSYGDFANAITQMVTLSDSNEVNTFVDDSLNFDTSVQGNGARVTSWEGAGVPVGYEDYVPTVSYNSTTEQPTIVGTGSYTFVDSNGVEWTDTYTEYSDGSSDGHSTDSNGSDLYIYSVETENNDGYTSTMTGQIYEPNVGMLVNIELEYSVLYSITGDILSKTMSGTATLNGSQVTFDVDSFTVTHNDGSTTSYILTARSNSNSSTEVPTDVNPFEGANAGVDLVYVDALNEIVTSSNLIYSEFSLGTFDMSDSSGAYVGGAADVTGSFIIDSTTGLGIGSFSSATP